MLMGTPPVTANKVKTKTPSRLKVSSQLKSNASVGSFESKRELLRKYLMFKDESPKQKADPPGRLSLDQFKQFKNNDDRFMITERFIFLLGLLYTVLAVVAFALYDHKRALYLTGIPCQLHVYKYHLMQFFKRVLRLNSSITNLLINLFWLIFVLSVIIFYILRDKKEPDKIEFLDEIILHVGLIIYSPFVLYSCYVSCKMIRQKIEFIDVYNEINQMS